MFCAIEVELVGSDVDCLTILLALIGPAMIAGAAVFAAVTARKSAVERQEEQLTHDTQRQQEALAHDLQRQELALEHDREMRDRESTRLVLDDAMESANAIIKKFTDFEGAVNRLQATMNEDGKGDPALYERASAEERNCSAAITELMIHSLRLRTRPDLDELSDAYRAVRTNYEKHMKVLEMGLSLKLSAEQTAELKGIDTEGTARIAKLLTKWREWLGGK